MKSIECINFVSQNAPNILLIGTYDNINTTGRHLKHFKNTHNIYVVLHNTSNQYADYYNLPSKHKEIIAELDKHKLFKFSISTVSFGSLLAFYLIFHLSERVEKAFIHDYYIRSYHASNSLSTDKNQHIKISLENWIIPNKSSTKIMLLLCKQNFITKSDLKSLKSIFNDILFISTSISHSLSFKQTKKFKLFFKIYNGVSYKNFWNTIYPLWINNKKLPLSFRIFPRKLTLKIFLYFCKKKGYKIKH